MALLLNGLRGSASKSAKCFLRWLPVKKLGSKVGALTMHIIPPVAGSMATTLPTLLVISSSAIFCSSTSSDEKTFLPATAAVSYNPFSYSPCSRLLLSLI